MATRLTPRDTIAGRITEVLGAIEAARRCAVLYPQTHPKFRDALETLRETLVASASGVASLKLTVYKQECFLNGQPPELPVEIPVGLSDRFLRLGLASVEFPSDVTSGELGMFLKALSTDTRRGQLQPDPSALAKEHGLTRIILHALDYGRLFTDGVGTAAEVGERDAEHFALLLTLWDPRPQYKAMSPEDIEALGRLAEDRTAVSRLMELSLKNPTVAGKTESPLAEGMAGALDTLAERLRSLYPERWPIVRKTLVDAALALDSDLLLQLQPDLLTSAPARADRAPTPADEMDDSDLVSAVVEAMTSRTSLDDGLAMVIRNLIPADERRTRLEPQVANRLALQGIPEGRRVEMLRWWEERVVRGAGFHDDIDPLFYSLMGSSPPRVSQPPVDDEWCAESLNDEVVLASYFDDLKALVRLAHTPEETETILSHFHTEFVQLAQVGDFAGLRRISEELALELAERGHTTKAPLGRLFSVTLSDRLAHGMLADDALTRSAARLAASAFGVAGVRAVMNAVARIPDWDICEELRAEVIEYGSEAEEEVVRWLMHADYRVVKQALLIIRGIGSERAIGKVDALLGHRDPEIRAAALAARLRIGGTHVVAAVDRCLRDASHRVVQVALNAAAEMGPEACTSAIGALLRGHRDDPDFLAVRLAAIRLAARARLVSLREPLEEVVRGAGSWTQYTKDERLAVPAAQALLNLGDPAAREFVCRRARWGVGAAGKACRAALKQHGGAS